MFNRPLFDRNHAYIHQVNPVLAAKLIQKLSDISIEEVPGEGVMLHVGGECWTQNLGAIVQAQWASQSDQADRVMMARIVNEQPPIGLSSFLPDVFDSESLVTLSNLPNLSKEVSPSHDSRSFCRDILLLGAFALLYVPSLVKSNQYTSIVLVESELAQFTAALHFIDFSEVVADLKQRQIGFHFIYEESVASLQSSLLSFYGSSNPLALHGLRVFRSFFQSPPLIELHSWLHAQDGLAEHCKGFLGNDTDEINQTIHAVWNSLVHANARRLTPDVLDDADPLVVVASGPSLDQQLTWLKQHHANLTIVSAGSSLGTLLRSGIDVAAAVLLEMGTLVFRDISDLLLEGYDLSHITLFASVTIDPRIASEFKDVVFFHRPLSSAFTLFPEEASSVLPQAGPQAANAALEVALQLGSRNLLLLGCDFAAADLNHQRSGLAIGSSERSFDLPVPGRLGTTVFSSAELSVTRQLFENAIQLYGADATSIGNGAMIRGITALASIDQLESIEKFYLSTTTFRSAVEALPRRANQSADLVKSLASARADVVDASSKIRQSLVSSMCWSHRLSTELGAFITWDDQHLTSAQRLRQRLTRFLYFFVFQPLHDQQAECVDAEQWSGLVLRASDSIQLIEALFDALFSFLIEISEAQRLPLFDALWIKKKLLSAVKDTAS